MKSPMTGKEMILTKGCRLFDFRKEEFEIIFHYYDFEDSWEQFSTTGLDEWIINQGHQSIVQRNRRLKKDYRMKYFNEQANIYIGMKFDRLTKLKAKNHHLIGWTDLIVYFIKHVNNLL
jgi:hypothetical protein